MAAKRSAFSARVDGCAYCRTICWKDPWSRSFSCTPTIASVPASRAAIASARYSARRESLSRR
jgi:hypothetical protein